MNVPDFQTPTPHPVFTYFSNILECEVIDPQGETAGTVYDIIVQMGTVYPRSSGLIIRKGFINHRYALIPWEEVVELGSRFIKIKTASARIVFSETHQYKDEFSLRKDVLDQQVVDTYNHKVIRVNDIHFLQVDNCLNLAHVDIGLRGLIRRLGWERYVDFLIKLSNKQAKYLKNEYLISWKYIQPLAINPVSMTIRINVPQNQLNSIPAPDMGEILQDLNTLDQVALFKSLDLSTRAKVFMNVDFKTQELLIDQLGIAEIATILNVLPSDEATDFLEKLPKDMVQDFLRIMESKQAKKLSELLGYSSDSAGGLMTTEYLAFRKGTAVGEVIRQIREKSFKVEPVQFVYVIDDESHLVGSVNFKRLMLASPEEPVEKIAFPKTYYVKLESSVKEVAYLMEKYKYNAIPVVDGQIVLKGIVTVDDVLGQVIAIAWRRLKKIQAKPVQQQR
ncbi:MAG: magnesium transporter MgtE N-terminal domain-containing protein [Deltaproteobacteria bacterium]